MNAAGETARRLPQWMEAWLAEQVPDSLTDATQHALHATAYLLLLKAIRSGHVVLKDDLAKVNGGIYWCDTCQCVRSPNQCVHDLAPVFRLRRETEK